MFGYSPLFKAADACSSQTKMYAVLQDSSSSDDDENIEVPDYEDLSSNRADEMTVLQAVYGNDFTVDESTGVWTVRAFDDQKQHEVLLQVKPNTRYPYASPKISIGQSKLRESEVNALMEQLTKRAKELAEVGSVMMIELVQVGWFLSFWIISSSRCNRW